jgi:translation initiation factor IF-3
VRLVDENGQSLGIVSLEEAKAIAHEKTLDLIEVSGHTDPPVYKVGDYGKMLYQEKKKNTELKKKQHASDLKEIQLRPNIQEHDYQVKINRAQGFLQDKDKVKIVLRFRGREMAFLNSGKDMINKMVKDLEPFSRVDVEPKLEGRRILAVLSPLKATQTKK